MKKKSFFSLSLRACLTVLCLFFATAFYAQNVNVQGRVTDDTGEPVIGATVKVLGLNAGTVTDANGRYSLSAPANSTLEFSCMGFKTQSAKVGGGDSSINIQFGEDINALNEVVVTALGMKREQKALGYAVTELNAEDLDANVINPVQALQGKVAGVEISNGDGGLFGSSRILIRGASTLGKNNQPIYVVDGVILDNGIHDGDADWSQNHTDWGNELKNLNPDDFETVSILKGAAATALYGSRGLNGAVVITTKSGKGRKGLGINFSQTLGIDHVYSGPAFQNERGPGYMSGYNYYKPSGNAQHTNEFDVNADGQRTISWLDADYSWGPRFDGQPIEYVDYSMIPYSAAKNNFVDAYDNAFNTNTNVAIQGGNETTSFYTSMSYRYNNGTTPTNPFSRLSLLAKGSHKISKAVELEAGISFANSYPKQGGMTNFGECFIDGTFDRLYDTRLWRDKYKGAHGGLAQDAYGDEYGSVVGRGVWWSIYENEYSQKETVVRPSVKLTVDFTPWLKWTTEGNYNYYYKRYEAKELGSGYANEGGWYQMSLYTKEQTNFNSGLSWSKDLGAGFNLGGFLRMEYYHNFVQSMSENTNGGLVVPGQYFIGNSKETPSYSGNISGEKSIYSIAGMLSLSWRDQVYLDVTGRNDWSSSLVYADKHGNYSYFYPSVSGSWLISETFRDKLPDWISFMKVRGSWAQVGNDTDAYLINSAYSLYNGTTSQGKTYSLRLSDTAYDQNLKPERKNAWEIGLDWRFLDNRIGLDFTYYKENTKDQIMRISVPSVSGLSYQYINAGNIQNKGIEIALNTTPVKTRDWQWDLNFTYTKNTSKIVSLHENVADFITLTGMAAYGNYRIASVAEVGGEYGLLKSDATPNYDEKTGLPILETASYSGRHAVYFSRSGVVKTVGKIQPDFLGSINTSLRWKDLTLRATLDARFGGKVAIYGSHYGTAYGFLEDALVGTSAAHGGITYTSIWDGEQYDDGIIPDAMMPAGYKMPLPNGDTYVIGSANGGGNETYASLVERGLADPQHASSWNYWNNSWGRAAVGDGISDSWFTDLNYIALREVALSYRLPRKYASKIGAQNLNFTIAGRNLGYLLNSLPNHFNPESFRGTAASQFMIRSVSPYTASYTFTINATF